MTQALPPPEPIQQCVRSADAITALISVSGPEKQVSTFVAKLARYSKWKQEGEGSGTNGDRLIVLRGPSSLPYRDIGGLIYEAQTLGLAIVFTPSAQLCPSQTK